MSNNSAPTRRELRDFGLLTGGLTAGLFGLLFPLLRRHPIPSWPWMVAALLILPALALPSALRYPHWAWMRIGFVLGWLNSRIVLTILFFLVIVPMGLLMRALGHDPVARKLDPDASTYRVPSRVRPPESMERPF